MALSEDLPLYRAMYRLLNLLIRATQDFPRFYKYSLGHGWLTFVWTCPCYFIKRTAAMKRILKYCGL
jgi:hypothetical protein